MSPDPIQRSGWGLGMRLSSFGPQGWPLPWQRELQGKKELCGGSQCINHPRKCTEPCTTSIMHITCFTVNNLSTIYFGINTFAWASARTGMSSSTPKSVMDNMNLTGRLPSFLRELEISEPGCLDNCRVLHRVHKQPPPVTYLPRCTPLQRCNHK